MFDLIASLLAWFYSLTASHGLAILMLTLVIMLVFTPLIFRSTKSMMEMRAIQPKIKQLQRKHRNDKEKLNQETMALYQKHGVNPVGGCLPLFFQAPVFLVMYRVIGGLTRRTLDTGFTNGNATVKAALARSGDSSIALQVDEVPLKNFNPDNIAPETEMYQDLVVSNEMNFLGLDLSRTALEMLGVSIGSALPYFLVVVVVGVLSLLQHRQIQGRTAGAEMNPQMQMITRVMPWFLPIFSLSMPAALCVYFIGQSVVRVGQQFYITQKFYGDDYDTGIDVDDDDNDDDEFDDDDDGADPGPGGLLGQLMGNPSAGAKAEPSSRHGSRSPVTATSSARTRTRPPGASSRDTAAKASSKRTTAPQTNKRSASAGAKTDPKSESTQGGSLWDRARRRAETSTDSAEGGRARRGDRSNAKNTPSDTATKTSKRVTPKGGSTSPQTRKRK